MQTPTNPDVELALLKVSFYNPEIFKNYVRIKVVEGMFSDRELVHVFRALSRIDAEGRAFDLPMLKAYMGDVKVQQLGESFFNRLLDAPGSVENVEAYVGALSDQYFLRMALDRAMDAANAAVRGRPVPEVLATYAKGFDSLMDIATMDNSVVSMEELSEQMFPKLQYRMEKPGFIGIRTGFLEYDYVIGGLQPSHLILVAARPSVGKTSMLMSILLKVAKQGEASALFSYEMSLEQIHNRAIAMLAEVSHLNMVHGNLSNLEKEKILAAHEELRRLPFYIAYTPTMNIDEVVTTTTKLVRTKDVKVAALDYLQLMVGKQDANRELGYISRRLKLTAVQEKIAFIAASQLNRSVEYRENKRPILSDLRDSGTLEQDADIVAMLYRDYMYNPTHENEYEADFLIRKNRHGPIVDMKLKFDPACMKFASEERR